MYVTPKQMRRADAPVPAHVLAIAERQRRALAERMAAQEAAKQSAPAQSLTLTPVAPRRRRKASNRRRSI